MPEIKRTPLDAVTVVTLARAARLQLSQARSEELAHTMDVVFGLLDPLDDVALGETAPAFAYQAKWVEAK
jgi:Asp-tRNA(Asn)/Glu-tRNA(Gln) amidotransferase C subunit